VSETSLSQYYRTLDEGRIDEALALLDEKVTFVISLPGGVRRGTGRSAMADYLGGRGVPDRRHVVLREGRDRDADFVYGRVTEGGDTTGYFLAGARLGPDGHIAGYQVVFDTEHVLFED
jgi:ketosteroid isomerase-like protein